MDITVQLLLLLYYYPPKDWHTDTLLLYEFLGQNLTGSASVARKKPGENKIDRPSCMPLAEGRESPVVLKLKIRRN